MLEHGALNLLLRPAAPLRVKWSGDVQVHATQAHNRSLNLRSPANPTCRPIADFDDAEAAPVAGAGCRIGQVLCQQCTSSHTFLRVSGFQSGTPEQMRWLLGFLHFSKVEQDPSVPL
jgi:hypothetical protein